MKQAVKSFRASEEARPTAPIESLAAPASVPSALDEPTASELHGEHALRYCPVCSQRLESRRCKLICNRCGYYMSCADYI